jgi:hypothetical protein
MNDWLIDLLMVDWLTDWLNELMNEWIKECEWKNKYMNEWMRYHCGCFLHMQVHVLYYL